MGLKKLVSFSVFRFGVAVLGVAIVTALLEPYHAKLSSTTVALSFLLIILFSASLFGRNPALLSAFVAMLCFNYFFLPPVHTWTISEPQNLIAWGAFTITAVIAGELSAYARRRAREAERLYKELQNAFESASQTEALRQSEKLKSALLDAVTHDLRTPLTSIKASVTMLLEDDQSVALGGAGRRELLEVINEETDRVNNFVESMVDVAKLDAGEFSLRKTETEISEIIEHSLQRAESLLFDHTVKLDIPEKLEPITADAKAISEAVYNLIENAVKYSPKGTTIEITAQIVAESLRVSVEDEGAGIAGDQRGRIFEKFYRGDESAKGLGMGLAIVRGIIEAHGGTIWVEDGRIGAKFVFQLPIYKAT